MRWVKLHQLKYLLILLVCFETTAPAFSDTSVRHAEKTCCIYQNAKASRADLISILFISEPGAEERIEQVTFEHSSFILEIFNDLLKFQSASITWYLPQKKFNTHPPLFTLHRVLLI